MVIDIPSGPVSLGIYKVKLIDFDTIVNGRI